MRREAKDVIIVGSRLNSRKFALDKQFDMRAKQKYSVFGRRWAITFFDEAHELRSEGHLNVAAHALRLQSGSLVLCTATPLYNGEKVCACCAVRRHADFSDISLYS